MLAPATLAALPSTRAIPDRDVFYVGFPISSIRPLGLTRDHSHCPVLVPATLAALPSIRAIPNRDVFSVARIPATPFGELSEGGLEVFGFAINAFHPCIISPYDA